MHNPLLKKNMKKAAGPIEEMELQQEMRNKSFNPRQKYENITRPFSTKDGGETLMHKRKAL